MDTSIPKQEVKIRIKRKTLLEYLFRGISFLLVKHWLVKTRVDPIWVVLGRIPIMGLAFYEFALGQYHNLLIGAACVFIWEVLDHVDGDLAVAKNQRTYLGTWLDSAVDRPLGKLSSLFGFVVALGIYRQDQDVRVWMVLFLLAMGNNLFTFFLEHRPGKKKPTGGESAIEVTDPAHQDEVVAPASAPQESSKFSIKRVFTNIYYSIFYWELEVMVLLAILYYPIHAWFGLNSMYVGLIFFSFGFNILWIGVAIRRFSELRNKDKTEPISN